jgi:hypothetical protein
MRLLTIKFKANRDGFVKPAISIGKEFSDSMAGHSSLEPETDSKLCAIMNDLPPMTPFDRDGK